MITLSSAEVSAGDPTPSRVDSVSTESARATLPVADATLRTFLDYAFIFSMRGHSSAYENFLCSNYGNLCFINSFYDRFWDPFDFYPGPRLKQLAASGVVRAEGHDLWQLPGQAGAIPAFFRERIASGEYVHVVLDEYFLRGRPAFGRFHYIHNYLVVGWDEPGAAVALLGYFNEGATDFGVGWLPQSRFVRAFDFSANQLHGSRQEIYATWCYKYAETFSMRQEALYPFRPETVAAELSDFLNSTHSPHQAKTHNKDLSDVETTYGISTYDRLLEYFERVKDGRLKVGPNPGRVFHEHKVFMLQKMRFVDRGFTRMDPEIFRRLETLERFAREVRLMLATTADAGRPETFVPIEGRLRECRDLERNAYEAALRRLARG